MHAVPFICAYIKITHMRSTLATSLITLISSHKSTAFEALSIVVEMLKIDRFEIVDLSEY